MQLIRGIHTIRPEHHGCVLTIGNFDGVHLGHQAVLAQVQAQAALREVPATVMTFEPQPQELFAPQAAPARLTNLREKHLALAQVGVERHIVIEFNRKFASYPPRDFVEQVLVRQLGVQYLVVGDDFRFGNARGGDGFGGGRRSTSAYQPNHSNSNSAAGTACTAAAAAARRWRSGERSARPSSSDITIVGTPSPTPAPSRSVASTSGTSSPPWTA